MSQPTFPQIDPPLTREGSLNEIISSIAMEELSLSHILNAMAASEPMAPRSCNTSWAPCRGLTRRRLWRRYFRSTRA